ncbi:MAG: metallophosphoesterase [Oscillospiraceae bacterium]|nr:metallophosphoesterase [Oscillospiraceae bacterium]
MPLLGIILLSCAGAFILLLGYMHLETRLLKVRRVTIAAAVSPVRFMQFSDLHVGMMYVSLKKITAAVAAAKPDFLVFTGDYFQKEEETGRFISFMKQIRQVHAGPVFLCFGNHDRVDVFDPDERAFERVCAALTALGVTVLEDRNCIYNNEINIIGLSDERCTRIAERNSGIRADTAGTLAALRRDGMFNLLITHNSDILLRLPERAVDFAVTGHTHGAQVRTPFNIETKILHRRDKLASRYNMLRGLHTFRGIPFYINPGLGNNLFPIRFRAVPEITAYTVGKLE